VSCDGDLQNKYSRPRDDDREPQWNATKIMRSLDSLAKAWVMYRMEEKSPSFEKLRVGFLRARLHCGKISRNTEPQKTRRPIPSPEELQLHLHSPRLTTHSQDFILAIMPQYDFYKLPQDAKDMTFSKLFFNCFWQLERAQKVLDYTPVLGRVHVVSGKQMAPKSVPTSMALGDFFKLLNGPSLHSPLNQLSLKRVSVEPISKTMKTVELLLLSMTSKWVWSNYLAEEAEDAMAVAYDSISRYSGGIPALRIMD
jgi:hypothetical protein